MENSHQRKNKNKEVAGKEREAKNDRAEERERKQRNKEAVVVDPKQKHTKDDNQEVGGKEDSNSSSFLFISCLNK